MCLFFVHNLTGSMKYWSQNVISQTTAMVYFSSKSNQSSGPEPISNLMSISTNYIFIIFRVRDGSLRRSKGRNYPRRKDQTCTNEMPDYLDADADLFEVDESRAAPKLKGDVNWGSEGEADGPINWLSNFLQRSFFWWNFIPFNHNQLDHD